MMFRQLKAIIIREFQVIVKSPRMLFQAFLQPAIYFLIFVPAIAQYIGDTPINPNLSVPYTIYALPGIMIFNAFSNGQYAGISTYIDKLSGELEMLFGLPIHRNVLLAGKIFTASVGTAIQSIVLIILAILLTGKAMVTIGDCFLITLFAIIFSWIAVLLYSGFSSIIRTQDSFNIIMNIVTMPLVFTSSAFYPTRNLSSILGFIARINPLTYFVEIMRKIMFHLQFNVGYAISIISILLVVSFVFSAKCYNRSLQ